MGNKHIFHLGPLYCDKCNDYCIHHLETDNPYFGVGPTTPFNFWMDFIKTSKVTCLRCGAIKKFSKDYKELFEKLKKYNLISIDDGERFKSRIKGLISNSDILDNYSDENKESLLKEIMEPYVDSGIPYQWFDNYFKIMFNFLLIEKEKNDYLYK